MISRKINWSKVFYTTSLFLGLGSLLWGYSIYENTFIKGEVLIYIGLILSTVYFFLIKKHYIKVYKTSSLIYPFFQSMLSIGCLCLSLMLIIHYNISSHIYSIQKYKVIDTGQLAKSKQAYGIINYKGLNKPVIFKRGRKINLSNYIELDISKGFFGFDIIKKKNIVE